MLLENVSEQIQIIDNECHIAQSNDHYRATRLLAHTARQDHPIGQFSWGKHYQSVLTCRYDKSVALGNQSSLRELLGQTNCSSILQQFVKDRYCLPEGMNLVMISSGKTTMNICLRIQ
jgi:secreted Zn-dependent insulinase-like peptidase